MGAGDYYTTTQGERGGERLLNGNVEYETEPKQRYRGQEKQKLWKGKKRRIIKTQIKYFLK